MVFKYCCGSQQNYSHNPISISQNNHRHHPHTKPKLPKVIYLIETYKLYLKKKSRKYPNVFDSYNGRGGIWTWTSLLETLGDLIELQRSWQNTQITQTVDSQKKRKDMKNICCHISLPTHWKVTTDKPITPPIANHKPRLQRLITQHHHQSTPYQPTWSNQQVDLLVSCLIFILEWHHIGSLALLCDCATCLDCQIIVTDDSNHHSLASKH